MQQQQGFGRHPGGFPGGGFPGGAQEVRQEIHRRPDGTMVMRTTTITRRPDGTTQQQVGDGSALCNVSVKSCQVEEREIGANMNMGPFPGMRMEQRQMSEEEMKAMQEEMRKVAKQAVKEACWLRGLRCKLTLSTAVFWLSGWEGCSQRCCECCHKCSQKKSEWPSGWHH